MDDSRSITGHQNPSNKNYYRISGYANLVKPVLNVNKLSSFPVIQPIFEIRHATIKNACAEFFNRRHWPRQRLPGKEAMTTIRVSFVSFSSGVRKYHIRDAALIAP